MIQSYLIISNSQDATKKFINELSLAQNIHPLDITYAETEAASFGIKEIRKLQQSLYLKPSKGLCKAAILMSSELLTIAAQNALLKTLEEPPDNTIIILVSKNKEVFLPTILSRCSVVELPDELKDSRDLKPTKQFEIMLNESMGTRLKLAQDLAKNKEEALLWLTQSIQTLRKTLLTQTMENEQSDKRLSRVTQLTMLQKTHTVLSTTNVNLRLHLENLLLSL